LLYLSQTRFGREEVYWVHLVCLFASMQVYIICLENISLKLVIHLMKTFRIFFMDKSPSPPKEK
jgi:hypothetical protein